MNKRILLYTLLSVALFWLANTEAKAQQPLFPEIPQTVEIWLAADKVNGDGKPLPANGSPIDEWKGLLGSRTYKKSNLLTTANYIAIPSFNSKSNLLNYNPSLDFSKNYAKLVNIDKLFSPTDDLVNKAYYVFYVSQYTGTSGWGTVFSFSSTKGGTSRNNYVGWNYLDKPFTTANGTTRTHQGGDRRKYGVSTFYFPNSTDAGALPPLIYKDGVKNSPAFGTVKFSTGTTDASVIGASNTTSGYPYYGYIQELIVLSAPKGEAPNQNTINIIQSYLAIKYGLTLDNGASSYIASDGTVIWNDSEYKYGVFGVGRDDKTGLWQKQSTNTQKEDVSIALSDFEDTNFENDADKTQFSDKSFVMLGANMPFYTNKTDFQNGLLAYVHAKDALFNGVALPFDLSLRFSYKHKVKLSGLSTANIKYRLEHGTLASLIDGVLVSSDPDFTPANTRFYKVNKAFRTADIVVNDGEYIGLASKGPTGPAGVGNGLRVWVDAGSPGAVEMDGDNVMVWRDQTTLMQDFRYDAVTSSKKLAPHFSSYQQLANFRHAVYFQDDNAILAMPTGGPLTVEKPDAFTSFCLYYSKNTTEIKRHYTHGYGGTDHRDNETRRPAVGFNTILKTGRVRVDLAGEDYQSSKPAYKNNSTALHQVTIAKRPSPTIAFLEHTFSGWANSDLRDDSDINKVITIDKDFWTKVVANNGMTLGGASYITEGQHFQGYMPEFLIYERELTPIESYKINSYLGMKYAVTLDEDPTNPNSKWDYLLSDGTDVWQGNSLPFKNYHNNVAGIFRDDEGNAFNNKARSTGDGGLVTMTIEKFSEPGQGAAPRLYNDRSGLFWGHNAATGIETLKAETKDDTCLPADEKLKRIWLVKKTNTPQMNVQIDIGSSNTDIDGYNNYMANKYQAYLLVADDPIKLANNNWDYAIPGMFIKGQHHFEYTFREEFTYFALAFKDTGAAGSCETCGFQGEDKYIFTRGTFSETGGKLRLNSSNRSAQVHNVSTSNNNLLLNLDFSIDSNVRRMYITPKRSSMVHLSSSGPANAVSTIKYLINDTEGVPTAADASIAVGEIDRDEEVRIYGRCNGEIVYPTDFFPAPLSGRDLKKGHTFSVIPSYDKKGLIAVGNGRASVGRDNPRGKLFVQFGVPVQEIIIEQTKRSSGIRFIDLFPMKFSCPQPPPAPDENGYSFQKRGPFESHICEPVDYSFVAYNFNAGCDTSIVRFEDILPKGMKWLPNSLIIEPNQIEPGDSNGASMTDKNLLVNGLKLPPNGAPVRLRATATFDSEAEVDKTYYNQASIHYTRKDNGLPDWLESTDAYYVSEVGEPPSGIKPDPKKATPTYVLNEERDLAPITTSIETVPGTCYNGGQEVKVTLKLNNDNLETLTQMEVDLSFNEEYSIKDIMIDGTAVPEANIEIEIDDETGKPMPGFVTIIGFDLTGKATTTITYTIVVPAASGLIPIEMEDGTEMIADLELAYDLYTLMDDYVCLESSLIDAYGIKEIPYCVAKNFIIINRHLQPRLRK